MKFRYTILCIWLLTSMYAQNIQSYQKYQAEHSIASYYDPALKPFYHGVASGDPISDAVIIWTRVTPDKDSTIKVKWRVATDIAMKNIVKTGTASATAAHDYTVKVDVTGLDPATTYYYDFTALGYNSIIGRTRTAPQGNVDNVRMAVVSCSNYQEGYFNAYKELAKRDDLDVVLHLGDYIYEYETGGYGYSEEVDRKHLPDNEIISLDDYRIRYSYYRLDPDLRAIHQQHPFITVWDDHEFTNDAYVDGAENHNEGEGDWEERKANAFSAYFDWLPVRENSIDANRIYRKISYGNLADLFMIDTRIEGREKQIQLFAKIEKSMQQALNGDTSKAILSKEKQMKSLLRRDLNNHLNTTDKKFAENALSASEINELVDFIYDAAVVNATDKIKNNKNANPFYKEAKEVARIQSLIQKGTSSQVKQTSKQIASEDSKLDIFRKPEIFSTQQKEWLFGGLKSSNATWKLLGNQTMFFPLVPSVNLDQWDGYTKSREEVLETITQNNIENMVVLTGDIHTSWAAEVPLKLFNYTLFNQKPVGVEFITPSITSANGSVLGPFLASVGEFVLNLINPHVKSVNLSQHGYFLLDLNHDRAKAVWHFLDIDSRDYQVREGFAYEVKAGTNRLKASDGYLTPKSLGEQSPVTPRLAKDDDKNVNESMLVVGLYPNPVKTQTQLHYVLNNPAKVSVNVYNLNGQLVKNIHETQKRGTFSMLLDLTNLDKGQYIVEVLANDKQIATRKIIKN